MRLDTWPKRLETAHVKLALCYNGLAFAEPWVAASPVRSSVLYFTVPVWTLGRVAVCKGILCAGLSRWTSLLSFFFLWSAIVFQLIFMVAVGCRCLHVLTSNKKTQTRGISRGKGGGSARKHTRIPVCKTLTLFHSTASHNITPAALTPLWSYHPRRTHPSIGVIC